MIRISLIRPPDGVKRCEPFNRAYWPEIPRDREARRLESITQADRDGGTVGRADIDNRAVGRLVEKSYVLNPTA